MKVLLNHYQSIRHCHIGLLLPSGRISLHIRSRKTLERVEFKRSILRQRGAIDLSNLSISPGIFFRSLSHSENIRYLGAYRFSSTACLFLGDLFDRALDFGDVHGLVVDLDDAAQDGAHLDELVLVSCDEVDLC